MAKLRNYQQEYVTNVKQAYKDGFKSPCVIAPCGAGKSVIISEVARLTAAKKNTVLFLVHRRELINQIQNTFSWYGVDINFVEFGMVQTIVRKLDRMTVPKLIITDESHHGLAASYRKIYDYFSDSLRLGFTATPIRLNGSGLGGVNDILIEGVDAKWLIENIFLAPYKYYAPELIDSNHLKLNSLSEFSNKSIDNALGKTIYGDVIKHYRKLADGEQAIAYCHNIEVSKNTRDAFVAEGITAEHIDAKTPKTDRDEIIQKFRNKEIHVLCNVDLIGEGFDVPDCSTVIMLRPTQSLSLFIQQSMRGMRYREGKTSIIIDHVGNVNRHGLPDMERKWSLSNKKTSDEKPEIKIKQCNSCFAVYEVIRDECPYCGYKPNIKEQQGYSHDTNSELKEVKESKLKQSFRLDYRTIKDCKNMKDLTEVAKANGYKPGWAYVQGKRMGFIK